MPPRKESPVLSAGPAVRHHLRLAENARFLRRFPIFQLDEETPESFSRLLAQIDKAGRRTR